MLSTLVPAVRLQCGGHHTTTHFVGKIEAHSNAVMSANDPKRASSTHIFSSSFCVTENGSGRRGEEGIKSLPHNRVAFA